MFHAMARGRPFYSGVPCPIPWGEIESYARLHGISLKPWEVSVILSIDEVWMSVMTLKQVSFEHLESRDDAAQPLDLED